MVNQYAETKHRQLCWDCKKATGGCAWSDKFEPVNGWVAKEINRTAWNDKPDIGYEIYECPEFVKGDALYDTPDNLDALKSMYAAVIKDALNHWENITDRYSPKDIWEGNFEKSEAHPGALKSEMMNLLLFFNSDMFKTYIESFGNNVQHEWILEKYKIPKLNDKKIPIFKEDKR